jgi:hypothetical protein
VYALVPVFVKVKSSDAATIVTLLLDVLPTKLPSPEYVAVIEEVAPDGRLGAVRVAAPFATLTGAPSCVPLSKNVTVPLGIVGVPAMVVATVAINVTVCAGLATVDDAPTDVTVGC